jgi:hypothetical protein
MPANTTPIFVLTPNMGTARLVAAATASDGSGTLYPLMTAGVNGSRIDAVRFRNAQVALAASTAMVHRIYYSATNTSGSTTCRLVGEVATAAATRTAAAVGATSLYTFDLPLIMPSGSGLFVGQSAYAGAQDQFDAQAFAGDY